MNSEVLLTQMATGAAYALAGFICIVSSVVRADVPPRADRTLHVKNGDSNDKLKALQEEVRLLQKDN